MAHNFNVAILEDHPVFRTGIKLALSPMFHIALEADTAADFFAKLATTRIDAVVLDLILPDCSGISVAQKLRYEHPDIKILVLSVDTSMQTFRELVETGIDGFLSKNADEERLQEAMKAILSGENYFFRSERHLERDILIAAQGTKHESLTPREYDVMLALCKGLSCNEIADQMHIASKTVDNHKQHIFAKLGIHNIVQLVTYAVRNKIIFLG